VVAVFSILSVAFNEPAMALNLAAAIIRGNDDAAQIIRERYTIKRELVRFLPQQAGDADRFARHILTSSFHESMKATVSSEDWAVSARQGLPVAGGEWLYVLCRTVRPKCVVETGVASGVSTAYILKALDDNGAGRLYSIDLPSREQELWKSSPDYQSRTTPEQRLSLTSTDLRPTGWLIPEGLKSRWTLQTGLSREKLPRLLNELRQVDVFLHDSEHTYDNMLWEYRTVWPHLAKGGVLLSHDIGWNSAFQDFAREVNNPRFSLTGFGAILKQGPG
jgi:hypothetical protein